jgi:G3E family GTPase
MIPIVLITGFLGSGKTTLIRELYSKLKHKKICYLINEFSQLDVDGQILQMDGRELITVTGGSIFCQCLVTQFIKQLSTIAEDKTDWDALVIEASGISNPGTVLKMLQETQLDKAYQLRSLISVVEPVTFVKLIQVLPVIKDQIKAANYILINKTGISDSDDLQKTIIEIDNLNQKALITQTDYCKINFDPLQISKISGLPTDGPVGHEPQKQFGKFSIKSSRIWDISKLQSVALKFKTDIYRIKGIIKRSEDQIIQIDYSASGWNIQDHDNPDAICHLDFIYSQEKENQIRKAIREIR